MSAVILALGLAVAGGLVGRGFERGRAAESGVTGLEVTDALANPWRQSGPVDVRDVVTQGLLIRSDHPDVLFEASQHVGDLVEAGVVLTGGGGPSGGPTFLQSRLGGIRQANQGVFVIFPRDQVQGAMEETQMQKTVRVVTAVEYYLKD